ncbi:MAG: GNAT family N-acetyltransferase [Microbacterium sp. SCN 70-200]|uniref:GNAT family N-acetyltransferase n=1 Tax=unclassified Microbacterium TaxID=2609290 RepID=UPI00086A5AA9|nr:MULTISPECIES: GNAT family N-acetyltransferase [unclassified Microbacterium]MBN9216031.1 N-acetyltransferase [Microbacterium sp.]ODT40333.1 MAG: GNAT family N-acetyltransferase [Microbacterium sp. SCN 70-200]OJV82034.1 MAG: GNAT family N-acetyltransferase [Microbacterium sp. 70-16]
MELRDALPTDAAGIAVIYNDAVAHTTAIWNDVTVDATNRAAWIADRQASGFPVIVAVDGEEVVGYASYGSWRAFDGYRFTVEHSVYVRADQRGNGLGRTLMEAIIERAHAGGIHVMVAGIEARNEASIRLHEKLGFEGVGTLSQVGAKFDAWLDLTFMQLVLDDRVAP